MQRQLFSCSHATVDAILWRSASVHQNYDVGNLRLLLAPPTPLWPGQNMHVTCSWLSTRHSRFFFGFFSLVFKKRRARRRLLMIVELPFLIEKKMSLFKAQSSAQTLIHLLCGAFSAETFCFLPPSATKSACFEGFGAPFQSGLTLFFLILFSQRSHRHV